MESAPGKVVAACRLLAECGRGAYGTVWLAEDALGRTVAVKCLHTAGGSEYELKGLRNYMALPMPCPGLLQIFHAGVEDGTLVYVMEAADNANPPGEEYRPDTLAERLRRRGRLPAGEALSLVHELLDGLEAMHSAGMVHRDIKPENIVFVGGRPRLADPGLTRNFEETMSVAGTPGYIPPEFLYQGAKATPSADIYALGKVLYHAVTGNSPQAYPALPEDLPVEELYQVCLPLAKWCDLKPEERCQTCAECRRILPRTLKRHGALRRLRDTLAVRPAARRRALRWLAACLAALAVFATAAAVALRRHASAQRHRKQRQAQLVAAEAARRAQLEAELGGVEQVLSASAMQTRFFGLPDCTGKASAARALLSAGRLSEAEAALARLRAEMAELLRRHCPARTGGSLAENGRGWSFVDAPLVRAFLPTAERERLRARLESEAKRLAAGGGPVAGRDFTPSQSFYMRMCFVAPGQFRSPVTKTVRRIDYPFWILEAEISGEFFTMYAGFPQKVNSPVQAAEYLSWNDALRFCRNLHDSIIAHSPSLPPGYAIRIPTEEEWEFAALGGWADAPPPETPIPADSRNRVPGVGAPNPLGLRDLGDNLAELVEPYADLPPPGVPGTVAVRGGRYCDRKSGIGWRRPYTRDQFHMKGGGGLRFVLAPTAPDYYARQWHRGPLLRRQTVEGRPCLGFWTVVAPMAWQQARDLAAVLGARLPEPAAPQDLLPLYQAFALPESFPCPVGIHADGGRWRRLSDAAEVSLPDIVPRADRGCLDATTQAFLPMLDRSFAPVLLLQWPSEAAFAERGARLLERACVARVEHEGRRFAVCRLPMAGYAVRPFVGFLGLRQPVWRSRDSLRGILPKLPADLRVALGPIAYYKGLEQLDGTTIDLDGEAFADIPRSPVFPESLAALAAVRHQFHLATSVDAVLLEVE